MLLIENSNRENPTPVNFIGNGTLDLYSFDVPAFQLDVFTKLNIGNCVIHCHHTGSDRGLTLGGKSVITFSGSGYIDVTTKGIVRGINTAIAASKLTGSKAVIIYTGKPFCFNREIIKAIQNGNKTVVYYFVYEGHLYSVTVPATIDATKVLERSGFAGPLYVGQQLGTTRLIRQS